MDAQGIRVNLHCHTTVSDGSLSVEALADHLAADGAAYASLTDHDTLEGCPSFRQSLARRGIGCVDGVEITTRLGEREIHLLAYGVDPRDGPLAEALAAERRRRDQGVQGLVDSVKRIGSRQKAAAPGALSASDAIRLAHAAGGALFLAHPLSYGMDSAALGETLDRLAEAGMDGIEAVYGPYPQEDRHALEAAAAARGMAVSGGSDLHDPAIDGQARSVVLTREQWKGFRDALLGRAPATAPRPPEAAARRRSALRMRPGRFALRIVAPTALAIALFVVSLFAILVPRVEAILLERKKEMIRELTNSAVSVLAEYAADEAAGRVTREVAQREAAARIRDIRYGREAKDYFWITDMQPRMIMHPYRTDLVGTEVGGYADANGVRVFVEFVNAVREKNEGYVEYLWQWEDDAQRIVPKLSFVKRFPAWDWVVGTGIYLEDVRAEIDGMTRRLIWLSVAIGAALALLLAFVAAQGLGLERDRAAAEAALRDSHERYRALVEASTEGMVMVSGGACTYANATFLDMLGFTAAEIQLHALADLVDAGDREDASVAAFLRAVSAADVPGTAAAGDVPPPCECLLRGREARPVDCLLTASRFELAGRRDWVVAARSLGAARDGGRDGSGAGENEAARPFGLLAARSGRGMFRAAGARRAQLVEANTAAREALGIPAGAGLAGAGLYGLLAEPAEAERLAAELSQHGSVVDRRVLVARPDGSTRTLSLTVVLAGGDGAAARLEGFVDDVTASLLSERLAGEQLAEARASSLALAAPAASLARTAVACPMNSSAREAARLMSRRREAILLVTAPTGEALGVLTDGDLRERLLAPGGSPETRVRDIMSAPIVGVPAAAPLSEALRVMGEKEIGHLAVRGPEGEIVGILRGKDLVQVHRQALSVMESDIEAASSPEELGACRARLAEAVRLMGAGGARPSRLARVLSSVTDAAVAKLVQLAAAELGPAPAEFAFLVLGSSGREEQTLGADQDNAIIHAGRDGEPYFLEMGRRVCTWLAEMGVPACPGAFMASNPSWCASRERWQEYFARWVREPEGRELLDCNIFFDFRAVAGSPDLAGGLRAWLAALLADNPPFFLHMARDALAKRLPPLFTGGVLRDLLGAGGAELDLKEAMSPLVHFARLYALRHAVAAASTAGRLAGLREAGVISAALHEQIERAWWFLWQLRAHAGAVLDTRTLSEDDRAALRSAASQVVLLHKRISFDFLGSAL